jgi:hypothetical protein
MTHHSSLLANGFGVDVCSHVRLNEVESATRDCRLRVSVRNRRFVQCSAHLGADLRPEKMAICGVVGSLPGPCGPSRLRESRLEGHGGATGVPASRRATPEAEVPAVVEETAFASSLPWRPPTEGGKPRQNPGRSPERVDHEIRRELSSVVGPSTDNANGAVLWSARRHESRDAGGAPDLDVCSASTARRSALSKTGRRAQIETNARSSGCGSPGNSSYCRFSSAPSPNIVSRTSGAWRAHLRERRRLPADSH